MKLRDRLGGIQGSYTAIPHEVGNSPAFVALSYPARSLLFDFYIRLRGTNNGNISAPLSELKHRGWASPTTLSKSLKELEALGFIQVTRDSAGVKHGSKLCKLYRLTDRDSYSFPKLHIEGVRASRDYLQFKSIKEAKSAIKKAASKKIDDTYYVL